MIQIIAVLLLLCSCGRPDPIVGTIVRKIEIVDKKDNICAYTTGGNSDHIENYTCVIYAQCGIYNPGDTIRLCK